MVRRARFSWTRYAWGFSWAATLSHDHVPMTTSGWYLAMIWGRSDAHDRSVLRPHPPKAVSATTCTPPVASSAAVMPGALSAITLSPMIQARRGSVAVTTRPAGRAIGIVLL